MPVSPLELKRLNSCFETQKLKQKAGDEAVEECVSEGILAEFFAEHREEIVEMGVYEFDQEVHDKVLLEDGEAIGKEIGKEIGREEKTLEDIKNIMETLKLTWEQAMAALKIPEADWVKYREKLNDNRPPDK